MMKGGALSVAKGAMQADRGLLANVFTEMTRHLGDGLTDELIKCIRFSPFTNITIEMRSK